MEIKKNINEILEKANKQYDTLLEENQIDELLNKWFQEIETSEKLELFKFNGSFEYEEEEE